MVRASVAVTRIASIKDRPATWKLHRDVGSQELRIGKQNTDSALGLAWLSGMKAAIKARVSMYQMFDIESRLHLSAGLPCVEILPLSSLKQHFSLAIASEANPHIFQYGLAAGYYRFREELSAFIGRQEGRIVEPSSLFVTNGATQGTLLALTSLNAQGAVIIAERPTYYPLVQLFKSIGLRVEFAPVDREGISVDAVKSILCRCGDTRVFIHCIPHFQNPSGASMSRQRAADLDRLVASHPNLWLLCDEVYRYLDHTGKAPGAPSSGDRVIRVGSFSKLLGPGFRVGWLELAPKALALLERSGYVQSSGGFNPIVARLLESVLQSTLADHIVQEWRRFLKTRQEVLISGLAEVFPEAEFTRPNGGYFLWVNLFNSLLSCEEFERDMKTRHGVVYLCGNRFACDPALCQTYIRLGYGTYSDDRLIGGLRLLRDGLRAWGASNGLHGPG